MIKGYHHCQRLKKVRYGACRGCPGCRDARHDVEAMLDHADTTFQFLEGVADQAYGTNDFSTHARVMIALAIIDELCSSVGGPDWRKYGLPVADAG